MTSLSSLLEALTQTHSNTQRLRLLKNFVSLPYTKQIHKLTIEEQLILYSLEAIGQLQPLLHNRPLSPTLITSITDQLLQVERFYKPLGGVIGYHYHFQKLAREKESPCHPPQIHYEKPPGIHLEEQTKEALRAVRQGIEQLGSMCDIYPVAGAADRLDLRDEKTKQPLPAAQLCFFGHTLLERLMRDVQAREYLHFKLLGKQICTPLVFMTSEEKNNHAYTIQTLEKNNWFYRPQNRFLLLQQPLVPVISSEGQWIKEAPGIFMRKPGGHGSLWKLLDNLSGFSWLRRFRRRYGLVRQINNPICGLDNTLLALIGMGAHKKKLFGFTCCKRLVNASEGMDVLIEKKTTHGYSYTITNIEYTDFEKQGIADVPEHPESPYSRFPTNTNILFVDLQAIQKALKRNPFPGLLINLKTATPTQTPQGARVTVSAGRLESTMQNIADQVITYSKRPLKEKGKRNLRSFVLYNSRHKTIAATKRSFIPGKSIQETPEGAFYELQRNAAELFTQCGFLVPPLAAEDEYLQQGPSFFIDYLPALGPLYSVISQKIRGGNLHLGAHLHLEIAELNIEQLDLKGSLSIQATDPLGSLDSTGHQHYGHNGGKCLLRHVTVVNQGVDRRPYFPYWRGALTFKEQLFIKIEGDGEFFAENVTFKGAHTLHVPAGHRMVAHEKNGAITFTLHPIKKPSWYWEYHFTAKDEIRLISCKP